MSNPVDHQIRDIILNHYQEAFRLLKDIETGYPRTTALFTMDGKQYTNSERSVLSGTNSIILITQVALVSCIANINLKRIPELKNIDLSVEETANFADNMLISRYHDIAFKRLIVKDNNQELSLTLNIDKVINMPKKGLIFFRISYDICNGSFIGKATAAYNVNKASLVAEKMKVAS